MKKLLDDYKVNLAGLCTDILNKQDCKGFIIDGCSKKPEFNCFDTTTTTPTLTTSSSASEKLTNFILLINLITIVSILFRI
jgi:hypothetical protein